MNFDFSTIKDRIREFATDDLLFRMGLQPRPTFFQRMLPAAGIFAGGVVVGIGIGILFAPSSGAETRDRIRKRANGVGDRAKEIYSSVMDSAEETMHDALETARGSANGTNGRAAEAPKVRNNDADKRAASQQQRRS